MKAKTENGDINFQRVMVNMAGLLDQLAADLESVSDGISELSLSDSANIQSQSIIDFQKLDNLHQSLIDLARLTEALTLRGEMQTLAISSLQLATTKDLLDQESTIQERQAGSLDLF
ncbi:hypothetical protein [uncultured Tateyamaria sp.]|uniref:hypothetical protein n=2 Tax=uncultured Tateyamaria sp. TaxID=455651 RepID=UPI00260C16E6|nr:hypothetical protein [uncultured Tateyamaria sp.]